MVKKDYDKRKIPYDFNSIITRNHKMEDIIYKAKSIAISQSPVLIYGDTGTGKELIVQAIHNCCNKREKPFIALNCAAIPINLLEVTLFGAKKGSYTGSENVQGLLEKGKAGTLYLDELNSIPIDFQPKLLRLIQEKSYRSIGDTLEKKCAMRIIASVNERPEELIEKGVLRKDLYYRLSVIRIDIPRLKERLEDIEILVNHFIKKYNKVFQANIEGLDREVLYLLKSYDWPGNVRQLENLIEGIFNFKSVGIINKEDIISVDKSILTKERKSLKEKIEFSEKEYIIEALTIFDNNVSKASEFLRIPRQTLQYKIKKYNLY